MLDFNEIYKSLFYAFCAIYFGVVSYINSIQTFPLNIIIRNSSICICGLNNLNRGRLNCKSNLQTNLSIYLPTRMPLALTRRWKPKSLQNIYSTLRLVCN